MAISRRALLRTGLTVTAVGATGAISSVNPLVAGAAPKPQVQPPIAGTAEWGARPPNGTITVLNHQPTYIVIHHTAGPNSDDLSQEYAFSVARGIQNYHMDNNGWLDSGQQFTNSRGGWLMEGRHRSLEILNGGTQHVQGAHVANNNSTCIGIENDGTYVDVDVTPELWDSLVAWTAYTASQYGVPVDNILGHRDFNATQCPGEVLYGRLPELRDAVAAQLGQPVVQPVTWPLLSPGDSGAKVRAAQHLLRANGVEVRTDGRFGPRMFDAVRRFATANNVSYEPCYASRVADESGLVGATTWPLLVRPVRVGDSSEAARAARILLSARGEPAASSRVIDTAIWQQLLG